MPDLPLPVPPGTARPLLVTGDPDVLDDLLRLAETSGTAVDVAPDPTAARRWWSSAPLVVVGPDAAVPCALAALPRRDGVVLLGDDLDDAGIWQLAVDVGAEHVVLLPDADGWLTGRLTDAAESGRPEGALLAVVGGRGGAGATTLACALAVTATRRGSRALLVDGDPLGGGIDLVFGGEEHSGLRWPDLQSTRGRVPAQALTGALPQLADLSVLSWDRGTTASVPVEAVRAVVAAGRRAYDVVVVDLPRTLDDCARDVLAEATTALLVVPAEVRAAAAASRVAGPLGLLSRDVRVVVRGPAPGGLRADDVARALGLPLQGDLRPEPGLETALERGEPPARSGRGPLWALCGRLLDEVVPVVPVGRAA